MWTKSPSGNGTRRWKSDIWLPIRGGLYDTVGNLREWTLDKTDGISGGTVDTTPRTDPVGPNVGANRVYRGWIMQPDPPLCYMVLANRNDEAPATSAVSVRFCIHLNPLNFEISEETESKGTN